MTINYEMNKSMMHAICGYYSIFKFTRIVVFLVVIFNYTATTEIYTYCHTLSLHDSLPISVTSTAPTPSCVPASSMRKASRASKKRRSEEHTSELQSLMRSSYAVFCLKKTIYDANKSNVHVKNEQE